MKKFLVFILLVTLMSFSNSKVLKNTNYKFQKELINKLPDGKFFFHIDINTTSGEGCTIHIVGDVGINYFRMRLNSFVGSVTIGGPGSCPHTTLTINWHASEPKPSSLDDGEAYPSFDTEDVCDLSQITWAAPDDVTQGLLNSSSVNDALVDAIKSSAGCDLKIIHDQIKSKTSKQSLPLKHK